MSKAIAASPELIVERIFYIRGNKVMLDRDLAELYGVSTKRLNEQVKRNLRRFPEDFMFRLTQAEMNELVANCDRFASLKHSTSSPYAFTEHGVAMLSSVLNSQRAVDVNIVIIRTFVKLRQVLAAHKELADRLKELEKRMDKKDKEIITIFETIRRLMSPPPEKKKEFIGFHP